MIVGKNANRNGFHCLRNVTDVGKSDTFPLLIIGGDVVSVSFGRHFPLRFLKTLKIWLGFFFPFSLPGEGKRRKRSTKERAWDTRSLFLLVCASSCVAAAVEVRSFGFVDFRPERVQILAAR